MAATVYLINGARYLTSGEVASRLGVAQRTVLRWANRAAKGNCPKLLQKLEMIKDPMTGFLYFKEQSVSKLAPFVLKKRPVR